ncbi:hypothetical protein [Salinispora arenicola]|uniref:hypothetical protein n=1 Tax=Salinispora arenicola TaxID=168697 RepID=UPI00039FA958|nr:hypothetical protein [Salinispora arenicola]
MPRRKSTQKPVTIRFDQDVYEQVIAYASQTRRSVNASVNALLMAALRTATKRGEYVPPRDSPADE